MLEIIKLGHQAMFLNLVSHLTNIVWFDKIGQLHVNSSKLFGN